MPTCVQVEVSTWVPGYRGTWPMPALFPNIGNQLIADPMRTLIQGQSPAWWPHPTSSVLCACGKFGPCPGLAIGPCCEAPLSSHRPRGRLLHGPRHRATHAAPQHCNDCSMASAHACPTDPLRSPAPQVPSCMQYGRGSACLGGAGLGTGGPRIEMSTQGSHGPVPARPGAWTLNNVRTVWWVPTVS